MTPESSLPWLVRRWAEARERGSHQTRARGGVNMSVNRTIEIIIFAPSGEIQIDAVGFMGPDCGKARRFLGEALGVVGQKIKKPEYHQRSTRVSQQRIGE